jgi:DNA-binding NtrC family response regulator
MRLPTEDVVVNPSVPTLAVLQLSDAFEQVWATLAEEAGLRLELLAAPVTSHLSRTIMLVAAGGEERAAEQVVRQLEGQSTVVVGADTSRRVAVELIRAGASEYFALPEDYELIRSWLREQADRLRLRDQRTAFADSERQKYRFEGILGDSPALSVALDQAARIIPHPAVTVLLAGETGTGKELLARAIHYNGPRREAPFVDINCAAIPEQLLESELFGHEKGAFTGAGNAKPGLFEEANGGTLFLDELGHLPLTLQGKLLRALEERTIRRVGGVRPIKVDVRIMAATHVNLSAAVKRGEFREDLYYRLNVVAIELPPLRARHEDIIPLARHFLERFSTEYGIPRTLTPAAQRALREHEWTGNIRELRNTIERAVLLGQNEALSPEDLDVERGRTPVWGALPFPAPLQTVVSAAVSEMLALCGGNKSEAARRLRISRTRLLRVLDGESALASAGAGHDDA